jgi:hypothetical protein
LIDLIDDFDRGRDRDRDSFNVNFLVLSFPRSHLIGCLYISFSHTSHTSHTSYTRHFISRSIHLYRQSISISYCLNCISIPSCTLRRLNARLIDLPHQKSASKTAARRSNRSHRSHRSHRSPNSPSSIHLYYHRLAISILWRRVLSTGCLVRSLMLQSIQQSIYRAMVHRHQLLQLPTRAISLISTAGSKIDTKALIGWIYHDI